MDWIFLWKNRMDLKICIDDRVFHVLGDRNQREKKRLPLDCGDNWE